MFDSWPKGPSNPQLTTDAVHVWQADLNVSLDHLRVYKTLLGDDENERAERFHFDRDREHYIAGRGMLRVLLGRYLHESPTEIEILYSEHGKPFLSGGELRFNLAHSGNLVLYAFCLDDAIGVDLEAERELTDALAIAERFFSPGERKTLRSLPRELQTTAFYRCWTRKEAFIKAVGEGLSYPLSAFDVTLTPGEPVRLLSIGGNKDDARQWTLFSVVVPEGYQGALAVEATGKQLQLWEYAAQPANISSGLESTANI